MMVSIYLHRILQESILSRLLNMNVLIPGSYHLNVPGMYITSIHVYA